MSDAIAGSARGWSALATDPRALARVIESAPYAAVLYRIDGDSTYRVVALNDPAAEALEHPAIEVLGLTLGEMADGDELAEHTRRYDDVVRTREPVEYSIEAATGPANAVCRCRFRVSPVSDDVGDVAYLFGTWWDVTDEEPTAATEVRELQNALAASEARSQESDARLQEAESRLQESETRNVRLSEAEAFTREREERFRTIADCAPTLIWTTDPNGAIDSVNRAWRDFRGITQADGPEDDQTALHPDDYERVLTTWHTALATRTPYAISARMLRSDGEWRWFKMQAVPRIVDDQFAGFIGAAIDITDRVDAEEALRRSEERSRALIENAPDMMLVLDETGCVLEASPSVQRILGLDPADWAGHSILELVHPGDSERVLAVIEKNVAEGGVSPLTEFRFRAGDGTWRVLEATGNNRYEDPSVGGVVINVRDITERRHLEEALGQANQLKAVGRLATNVANDFDELIGTITARAQRALEATPEESELRSDLQELVGAAARATSLVGQLLTLGRRPPGPTTLVDVGDVVHSMEPMLRQMLGPAVGLACGGPRVPVWVNIDPAGLEQIVMNLVVNAGDACSSEGGQIVVRTTSIAVGSGSDGSATPEWTELAPGRYVVLSVRDDGVGMDENTEAQALEPFFTTRPGQSTGLGLSIVHGIVVGHGGRLDIQTALGDGTTVRIALPETVPVTEVDTQAQTSKSADQATPAAAG